MIKSLRILSRIAVVCAGLAFLAMWWVGLPPQPRPQTTIVGKIDHILIEKQARRLRLFQDGKVVREYRVALGFAPEGDKDRQGDGKTPLGLYKINRRNVHSKYTLSIGINYPKPEDIARGKAGGYSPGGDIFIHGQPNSLVGKPKLKGDWTAGCIALSNAEIREIWDVVPMGTKVEIRP